MKNTCDETSHDEEQRTKKQKKAKSSEKRRKPNILVTGTPGTGKSTLCRKLADKCKVVNVGEFAKKNGCLGQYDEKYECHELDEDKLIDELEDVMAEGNVLVEHHVTDIFPERWFDAVFVLRADTTKLYDRLKTRDYNETKLQDNVQCEIFQTILDEARESYDTDIVHEIRSDESDDIEKNAANISLWIENWIKENT